MLILITSNKKKCEHGNLGWQIQEIEYSGIILSNLFPGLVVQEYDIQNLINFRRHISTKMLNRTEKLHHTRSLLFHTAMSFTPSLKYYMPFQNKWFHKKYFTHTITLKLTTDLLSQKALFCLSVYIHHCSYWYLEDCSDSWPSGHRISSSP